MFLIDNVGAMFVFKVAVGIWRSLKAGYFRERVGY
jgi:hypothetical protein